MKVFANSVSKINFYNFHLKSAQSFHTSRIINFQEPFTILGIETSCDDTGVAIVRSDGKVLGNSLFSSPSTHQPWGGIKPLLAKRDHEQSILIGYSNQHLIKVGLA